MRSGHVQREGRDSFDQRGGSVLNPAATGKTPASAPRQLPLSLSLQPDTDTQEDGSGSVRVWQEDSVELGRSPLSKNYKK